MDLLDYQSEGEEGEGEEPQQQEIQSSERIAASESKQSKTITAELSSSLPPPKKKKALDISILPQDIQDALTRGYVDSDDEGQLYSKKASDGNSETTKKKDPLLTLLPKPKTTTTSFTSPSLGSSTPLERKTAPVAMSPEKRAFPVRSARAVSTTANISLLLDPNYLDNNANMDKTAPRQDLESHGSFQDSEETEPLTDYGRNLKRKREREMEQQLMAGDTSAIFNEGVPIHLSEVVAEHHTWDAAAYATRQEREAAIMSKYTKDGSDNKGMIQPTKLQNRRHQLTSLALKAAETEIALLEATSTRRKSKAQTQAKYGW